ncbi:MAG: ISAs1 family transposase [Thiotrichaceae bacterium]|nr:ISAs1 family transposase [Thiotrichaceae bacterium]
MVTFANFNHPLLANQIPLPRGKAPCASTFLRLSNRLDVQELCEAFNQWMLNHYKPELIAIDGKSINSTVTHCHDAEQNFVSLVSFFGHQSHLVLQLGTLENSKQSEIHQVQALLSLFQVEKAIFTLDALHTQKKQ